MGSFFKNLASKLKLTTPEASGEELPKLSALDLSINPALEWTEAEFTILAQHEQQRQICQARLVGQANDYQTFVLGFDLKTNKLLLDSLFPALAHSGAVIGRHLVVELRYGDSIFVLDLIPEQLINHKKGPVLMTSIIGKTTRNDRRREERVAFDQHECPKAKVHIPLQPEIEGSVINLSSGGMLFKVFGHVDPAIYLEYATGKAISADCSIHFSGEFDFKCRANIRHIELLRKPSNHALIRTTFDSVPTPQQEILSAFMAASAEKNPVWHNIVNHAF